MSEKKNISEKDLFLSRTIGVVMIYFAFYGFYYSYKMYKSK